MFFTTYMQRQDPYSNRLLFEVYDGNKELVSEAVKDESGTTCLRYEGNVYTFPFAVKRIETAAFEFEYPIPSRKSSKLGYQIKKKDDVVAEYYGETAVVEKRTLFSKKNGVRSLQVQRGNLLCRQSRAARGAVSFLLPDRRRNKADRWCS